VNAIIWQFLPIFAEKIGDFDQFRRKKLPICPIFAELAIIIIFAGKIGDFLHSQTY
jgi:hypothetical protein